MHTCHQVADGGSRCHGPAAALRACNMADAGSQGSAHMHRLQAVQFTTLRLVGSAHAHHITSHHITGALMMHPIAVCVAFAHGPWPHRSRTSRMQLYSGSRSTSRTTIQQGTRCGGRYKPNLPNGHIASDAEDRCRWLARLIAVHASSTHSTACGERGRPRGTQPSARAWLQEPAHLCMRASDLWHN